MSYSWKCFSQWHPTPVLLPGKSHGWRSLEGCSPWGHWGSNMTERLYFHFSLSCIGVGNGNPLKCSCLENPRNGEAWWAAVYGVTQSRTRLKWLSNRLYGNCYNCNKSCLGTCVSRLVAQITQQQYILLREVAQNLLSLANLVPKLSQDVCFGKRSDGILSTLRYHFYLFPAASWKLYNAPLKLVMRALLCPFQWFYRKLSLSLLL